ncbi:MAG TPA: S8 family serine peptidase [Blastocatellia bacterium]|nr:S8 family serine peptidase [Blastocatellia bacterium]
MAVDQGDERRLNELLADGAVILGDYGSFKLLQVDDSRSLVAESLRVSNIDQVHPQTELRDDLNVLSLRSGAFDTTAEDAPGRYLPGTPGSGASKYDHDTSSSFRLIQFVGPVKREWLEELRGAGFEPIAYLPNNAFLVRTHGDGAVGVTSLVAAAASRGESFVQWDGPFLNDYKIHPKLKSVMKENPLQEVSIAIQFARNAASTRTRRPASDADVRAAKQMAMSITGDAYEVGRFTNLRMKVMAGTISQLVSLPNVVNIEPWNPPTLMDERADQISAGNLTNDLKQSRGPGYIAWLAAQGFSSPLNFVIDVADTGIDRGSTSAAELHPDFLDASHQSRVAYARDYTAELDPGDPLGHGTINLSIAGGSNTSADRAFRDSSGYGYGIGIAPFALLGSSKIFESGGAFGLTEPYTKVLSEGYRDGARISSNSWGAITNEYSIDSQEYDSRVRDADPAQPGNQEMTICFAAGNSGFLHTISMPGTAKNIICVAASENSRQDGIDGCGVRDSGADNAMDIAFFSSGGPLDDGRLKPDITAPGSHIQGAASQHPNFDGSGVCGLDVGKPYFPEGQTLYTWSSGTSHSTPEVAGAAALIRQSLINRGEEPTAALVKAFLLNSTTYMTGDAAGGDLPHPRQGWGLLNLSRALDNASRVIVNQTTTFTDSGQDLVLTGEIKDSSLPFRVTLAWTDAPGFSAFVPWVNDLDLEVIANGQVYRGNNFKGQDSQAGGSADTKNNVEGVWLPAGTTGAFVVRVKASNIAGDGRGGNGDLTDQDFALVIYNAERKDSAVAGIAGLTLTGGADSIADPGESVSMTVSLTDLSPVGLAASHAILSTTTQGIAVTTGATDFPAISPGQNADGASPLAFSVDRAVPCGTPIKFTLTVQSPSGQSAIPFVVAVGRSEALQLMSENVESGAVSWAHASAFKKKKKALDTWSISVKRFHSPGHSWFSDDPGKMADAHLDAPPIQIPSDVRNAQLVFFHTFSFELGSFDGGVLEISTGGDFQDLGPKILTGGYTGEIDKIFSNPLAGRAAWVDGQIGGMQQVVVDLSSFAGKTVKIRFRFGSDTSGRGVGWFIDDIALRGDRVTCTQ